MVKWEIKKDVADFQLFCSLELFANPQILFTLLNGGYVDLQLLCKLCDNNAELH